MAKAKLHDDWETLGTRGLKYELVIGPNEATVIVKADEKEGPKRDTRYRLDRVYAQLIRDAYAAGKAGSTLW